MAQHDAGLARATTSPSRSGEPTTRHRRLHIGAQVDQRPRRHRRSDHRCDRGGCGRVPAQPHQSAHRPHRRHRGRPRFRRRRNLHQNRRRPTPTKPSPSSPHSRAPSFPSGQVPSRRRHLRRARVPARPGPPVINPDPPSPAWLPRSRSQSPAAACFPRRALVHRRARRPSPSAGPGSSSARSPSAVGSVPVQRPRRRSRTGGQRRLTGERDH